MYSVLSSDLKDLCDIMRYINSTPWHTRQLLSALLSQHGTVLTLSVLAWSKNVIIFYFHTDPILQSLARIKWYKQEDFNEIASWIKPSTISVNKPHSLSSLFLADLFDWPKFYHLESPYCWKK